MNSPTSLFINPKKKHPSFGIVIASASDSDTTLSDSQDRWLLQPVGDGDWRHIGYKVQLPDAFEIASDVVTVGRVADKADLVIPVATVSGIHARIQKKGDNLLVTDLDSTNGTFINDNRLSPGVVAAVSSGSFITFGDTNLAMFRVSKIVNVTKPPQDSPRDNVQEEASSPTQTTQTV